MKLVDLLPYAMQNRLRLAREKQEYSILAQWYKHVASTYAFQLKAAGMMPFLIEPDPITQDILKDYEGRA